GQLLGTYAVMLISAFLFATFGLYMSWLLKRTLYALMLSYTFVMGGLLLATAMITGALATLFTDPQFFERCPLMWINPAFMMGLAANPDSFPNARLFLIYGLLCYVVLSLLMLWRMIVGFRRFAYQA